MSIDKKVSHSIEHNTAVIFNAMTTARAIDQVVVFTIPDDLMEQVSKWVDGSHSYNAVRTFVRHNLTNYDTVRTAMAI